jgi:hypothetical protein
VVAARHDDCGECVQIAVNQARKAGVRPDLLQAVLADRWGDLPGEVADACRFAAAVVTASGEEDELRERIRQRYGIAENELSAMTRQCITGRRFATVELLRDQTTAWHEHSNDQQRGVDWQFKVDDARVNLKSVYPKLQV